jgi:replicative DNA helicase
MTRQQAREYINNKLPYELEKARVSGYICPFCGNGSGDNGTGIISPDGHHYKCFVCDFYGDYLDILKKLRNTTKEWDIFMEYNLQIDNTPEKIKTSVVIKEPETEANTLRYIDRMNQIYNNKYTSDIDYTDYYKKCNARAGQTNYFSQRGISKAVIDRFMLGYDPIWKHPSTPNAPSSARVIIPASNSSYTARAIDPATPKQYQKQKVNGSSLYNIETLTKTISLFIFITEGEFDALSVIEAGGQAVALRSTANVSRFIQAVKSNLPTAILVLALDNDKKGRESQLVLKERLEVLNITYIESNISGIYKDPNEALQKDRDNFIMCVKDPTKRSDKKVTYTKTKAVSGVLNKFIQIINNATYTKVIPTGFNMTDELLDGGLYEGLYVIGAVSGMGKSTFCLQIADQIAQQGDDILFFSLEMSQYQLISKSLSRLTYENDNSKNNNGFHYARTSRQILTGTFSNDKEKKLFQNSLQAYNVYNQNIYIYDGIGNISIDMVKQAINEHVSITGKLPVIIIDYLQILIPCEVKITDKQNIDNAVMELKKISMIHKIPILAVSSFNRDNYLNTVNMASFKESGAIEYSSDVLLGLQFKGIDELNQNEKKINIIKNIEDWQKSDNRELELKIIKNRNGASGNRINFTYQPRFNYFHENIKNDNVGRIKI